jgi:quinol monooxygenase YgiN
VKKLRSFSWNSLNPRASKKGAFINDLYQQINEPDTFYIIDGWASQEAVAAHAAHPNVSRVVDQLLPLLESPLVVTTSNRVSEP